MTGVQLETSTVLQRQDPTPGLYPNHIWAVPDWDHDSAYTFHICTYRYTRTGIHIAHTRKMMS